MQPPTNDNGFGMTPAGRVPFGPGPAIAGDMKPFQLPPISASPQPTLNGLRLVRSLFQH